MTGYIIIILLLVAVINLGPWDASIGLSDDLEQQNSLFGKEQEIKDYDIVKGVNGNAEYEELGAGFGEILDDEEDSVESEELDENGEEIPDTELSFGESKELNKDEKIAEAKLDGAQTEELSILSKKKRRTDM